MTYRESQRARATALRNKLFRDPGEGVYKNLPREFVLAEPALNLWSGIREDALRYCKENGIPWWDSGDAPTGHLLSSQVACFNHLYFLRQREDLATRVLQAVDPAVARAVRIDSGFVEFEKVGADRLGGEKNLQRGANCTSVDALMLGEDDVGDRKLFLIEWKYTESYASENKLDGDSGKTRASAYADLLAHPDCPLAPARREHLFYEPFYQLMRQTLLASEMVRRREYGATDWEHLHVIPVSNRELRERITAPGLPGRDISEAWKSVLKRPERFQPMDPEAFLHPTGAGPDTDSILTYLRERYWDSQALTP